MYKTVITVAIASSISLFSVVIWITSFKMFSNREVVEIFLPNWNEQNVINFIVQNLKVTEEVVRRSVRVWTCTFKYYWNKIRSKKRFFERKVEWLDSPFQVIMILLLFQKRKD